MGLKVRTAHGQDFWRCGIKFGKEPVVVPDHTCGQKFGSPSPTSCLGDALLKEPLLICEQCPDGPEPEATDTGEATKPKGGRGKDKAEQ